MISVMLPLRVVSESNMRGHWSKGASRAKEQRDSTRWALRAAIGCKTLVSPVELLPCVVTLTRIAPRRLDGDNLQRSLKAVRDGVADAMGIDDGDGRIEWRYEQRKHEPGDALPWQGARVYGVHIQIKISS